MRGSICIGENVGARVHNRKCMSACVCVRERERARVDVCIREGGLKEIKKKEVS